MDTKVVWAGAKMAWRSEKVDNSGELVIMVSCMSGGVFANAHGGVIVTVRGIARTGQGGYSEQSEGANIVRASAKTPLCSHHCMHHRAITTPHMQHRNTFSLGTHHAKTECKRTGARPYKL